MPFADLDGLRLHYRDDGPREGPVLVLSNALGTDLRMWDPILPHLPDSLRVIRYDRRGHGQSDVPPAPYAMGQLVRDTERLLGHLGVTACAFVGLSLGGMVGQGLAVKRPDLIRALVLSNTAARIGTAALWRERSAIAHAQGLAALAPATMERWFTAPFRTVPDLQKWQAMLEATPVEGWCGCAGAIAGTDFYTTTASLKLPVLGIASDRDGTTPPDLVRETTELVEGAQFVLLRKAGHMPQIERPAEYASALETFLSPLGYWR